VPARIAGHLVRKQRFMRFRWRPFARLAVLSAGLLLTAPQAPLSSPATPADGTNLASGRPEVRLRKLHLVRPDLIPYPIAYEVYC
jgi:hypothetical protein